jgi:hypothetical protein
VSEQGKCRSLARATHARSRIAQTVNATKAAATVFRYADYAELQGKEHAKRRSGRTRPGLPMSIFACLLLGAAMAGLYHLLPRSHPSRPFRAPLLVLGGFILAQGGLSAAIAGLGLVPNGPFHDLLQQLTNYDGERPVVLLIGSSFSEAGINPDALAEVLGGSGRAVAVERLAVGGAPHLERLHFLKEYLARAKRKPQLVLFEIAGGYDNSPLYQVHQMRFTDRMVAMMDGSSAWWAFRWLAGADGLSLAQRAARGSEILGQFALHVSHIGFLWNSSPSRETTTEYDNGGSPPTRFSDDDAAKLLEQAAAARNLKPDWPADVPTRWMSAFLAEEIAVLQRHSVERFAFYSVPSMQGANVAYARRFCAAITKFACIIGEDPNLLVDLGHGADWYDFDHLQGAAREVFTRWLGDRLVETGVWP